MKYLKIKKNNLAFSFVGALTCFLIFLFFKKILVGIVPKNYLTITSLKLTSSIHSVIIVISSIIFLRGGCSFNSWRKISYITIGYLVYYLLNYSYNYYIMEPLFNLRPYKLFILYIEHLLVIRLLLFPINKYKKIPAKIFLYEISTPFIGVFSYLIYSNQQETLLYKVSLVFFIITVLLFRVINFSYIFINNIIYNAIIPKSAQVYYLLLFTIMNYYFFFVLCKIFFYMFLF